MNLFLNVLTLFIMLAPYSRTTLITHKRNVSADELFKQLLKSTKLTAQVPVKNERRDNYICENVKPSANFTEFCASSPPPSEVTKNINESSIKETETNQTTQISTDQNEIPSTIRGPNKLEQIFQALYVAQAQVQLEVKQIQRAQSLAAAQQKALEEASMNVRTITGALHAAQQDVATAALRAQTAQLQLAAHDQLLFAARQKVDALSSQAVGLQAEDSMIIPKVAVDLPALLGKLKSPLPVYLKPTAIPAMCPEMESKFPSVPIASCNQSEPQTSSNQSAPQTSSSQKVRELEKTIQEILRGRYKNPIKKRNSMDVPYKTNEKEDLEYLDEEYFYKWFLRDMRKERRKRKTEAKHKNKRKYDNYYYDLK